MHAEHARDVADAAPRYPVELIDVWHLTDGRRVLLRPVLPQDEPLYDAFVRGLAPGSRYRRFHGPMAALPPAALARMVRVDHRAHVALVASVFGDAGGGLDGGRETEVAEARWVAEVAPPATTEAEFAIAVADAWQGRGLGRRMADALLRSAARAGLARITGDVLADNQPMLALARSLGARIATVPGSPGLLRATIATDGTRAPR